QITIKNNRKNRTAETIRRQATKVGNSRLRETQRHAKEVRDQPPSHEATAGQGRQKEAAFAEATAGQGRRAAKYVSRRRALMRRTVEKNNHIAQGNFIIETNFQE